MEEINFRQLCKNLKKRGYEPAEKGVSDFVEEYEKIVFSVEPKNMRLKDIVNKMKDLSDHTRAVWIDGILREFGNGFGSEKWREGYEQGKFEGEFVGQQLKDADKIRRELNKPVVPQYIADFITEQKKHGLTLSYSIDASMSDGVAEWYWDNPELFAKAWLDGYEVEKEKRYLVKMKGMQKDCVALKKNKDGGYWYLSDTYPYGSTINIHTRKELEDAGFGWIFSCEGIEVEEVE